MTGSRDGFETRAIHAGQPPDPATGAVVTPISLATTFAQSAVNVHQGYEYARSSNPTRAALEACLADLEGVVAVNEKHGHVLRDLFEPCILTHVFVRW